MTIHGGVGGQWVEVALPAIVLGSLVMLAAPVLVYELTDHEARAAARELTPVIDVGPAGAAVGVRGAF